MRETARRVRGRLAQAETPLDPVLEAGAPPLPGTGSRAFWVGLVVVSLSVVWALATFLILTNLTPIAPREEVVYVVLFVNLLLIVAMVAVIAVHAVGLWRAWEKKVAGARLHARIVGLFSLIAALPALLLAIAATTTFSRALDNWFNQQTMSIVQNSLNVAHAYLDEHGQVIRTDIVNMAKDLDDAAPVRRQRRAQVSRADARPGRPARPARRLRGRRQGRGEGRPCSRTRRSPTWPRPSI